MGSCIKKMNDWKEDPWVQFVPKKGQRKSKYFVKLTKDRINFSAKFIRDNRLGEEKYVELFIDKTNKRLGILFLSRTNKRNKALLKLSKKGNYGTMNISATSLVNEVPELANIRYKEMNPKIENMMYIINYGKENQDG